VPRKRYGTDEAPPAAPPARGNGCLPAIGANLIVALTFLVVASTAFGPVPVAQVAGRVGAVLPFSALFTWLFTVVEARRFRALLLIAPVTFGLCWALSA
jgi:hypothetical protein